MKQFNFGTAPAIKLTSSYVLLALLLMPVLSPLLWLLGSWANYDAALWQHLAQTQLLSITINTGVLLGLVGLLSGAMGVFSAWMVVRYDLLGRRFLEWMLVLPLAMPAYVLAFVVEGWLGVGGVGFRVCRSIVPLSCELPALFKASLTLSLVLYPYVYLLARVAFLQQSAELLAVSRTLGLNARSVFWRLALPLARPAIMAGLSLVLMEVAADFGAVAVFNFDTFTTAVYKTWFGFFSLTTAAQMAGLLMLAMFLLLYLERLSRKGMRYDVSSGAPDELQSLSPIWRIGASILLWVLVSVAFIAPVLQLLLWAGKAYQPDIIARLWVLLEHTGMLALLASAVIMIGVGALMFVRRSIPKAWRQFWFELASLGYAIPGTVLAVAVMLLINSLDQWIVQMGLARGTGWLLGTILGLLIAYWVRFLSVALRPIQASVGMIKPNLSEVARSLGASPWRVWWFIYLPLALPGVATGFLAAFVEIAKEMPATLLLRPFGWDTLAVNIYELTSEGEWYRAAWPGLTLVLLGLLPVFLLIRRFGLQQPVVIRGDDLVEFKQNTAL